MNGDGMIIAGLCFLCGIMLREYLDKVVKRWRKKEHES